LWGLARGIRFRLIAEGVTLDDQNLLTIFHTLADEIYVNIDVTIPSEASRR